MTLIRSSWFRSGLAAALVALAMTANAADKPSPTSMKTDTTSSSLETATFGTGCFWCSEAVIQRVPGVKKVTSGYMGGSVTNPTYEQVCSGRTGHAEVIQVQFDPKEVSYDYLLEVFWKMHDPTTLNRQGNDIGTQYRSVIFYSTPQQKAEAEASKKKANASGKFSDPIVTEIAAASVFYPAEDYHQDYYNRNKSAGYCRYVILPKLEKLDMDKK